jgi:hypothetical protein
MSLSLISETINQTYKGSTVCKPSLYSILESIDAQKMRSEGAGSSADVLNAAKMLLSCTESANRLSNLDGQIISNHIRLNKRAREPLAIDAIEKHPESKCIANKVNRVKNSNYINQVESYVRAILYDAAVDQNSGITSQDASKYVENVFDYSQMQEEFKTWVNGPIGETIEKRQNTYKSASFAHWMETRVKSNKNNTTQDKKDKHDQITAYLEIPIVWGRDDVNNLQGDFYAFKVHAFYSAQNLHPRKRNSQKKDPPPPPTQEELNIAAAAATNVMQRFDAENYNVDPTTAKTLGIPTEFNVFSKAQLEAMITRHIPLLKWNGVEFIVAHP